MLCTVLSVTIGSKLEEIKIYVKEISQPPDWSIKIIVLQSLTFGYHLVHLYSATLRFYLDHNLKGVAVKFGHKLARYFCF